MKATAPAVSVSKVLGLILEAVKILISAETWNMHLLTLYNTLTAGLYTMLDCLEHNNVYSTVLYTVQNSTPSYCVLHFKHQTEVYSTVRCWPSLCAVLQVQLAARHPRASHSELQLVCLKMNKESP